MGFSQKKKKKTVYISCGRHVRRADCEPFRAVSWEDVKKVFSNVKVRKPIIGKRK